MAERDAITDPLGPAHPVRGRVSGGRCGSTAISPTA
jgi:hypothetical protein